MSDVLETGGKDSIQLSADNMPAHSHKVNITTAYFDHGIKKTFNDGNIIIISLYISLLRIVMKMHSWWASGRMDP